MRTVAVCLALLSVVALVPTSSAANECYNDVAGGRLCVEIPLQNPGSPPGLPNVPPEAGFAYGTYYLWLGPEMCSPSPISNDCRGVPASPGSGVPTPVGAFGVGVFSVLYEESNSVSGLQRAQFAYNGALRTADHMVLV